MAWNDSFIVQADEILTYLHLAYLHRTVVSVILKQRSEKGKGRDRGWEKKRLTVIWIFKKNSTECLLNMHVLYFSSPLFWYMPLII